MAVPKDLLDAAAERRLLPVIGAGFSKNIDPKIPDWGQVINSAAEELGYDPEIMRLYGDYLQIAEYYGLHKRGLDELMYRISREIDNEYRFDVATSKPHLLLPCLDTIAIYTTNWDSWIERGFHKESVPYHKVVIPDDLASYDPFGTTGFVQASHRGAGTKTRYPKTQIVKFHGDFSRPNTIVVRESDYFRKLDFEHPLDIRLRSDIIGRSVLFIGYSFTDLNMRYMWYKLTNMMASVNNAPLNNAPRSFLVMPNPNPILEDTLGSKNIELVLLDNQDIKQSLTDLFEQLLSAQERGK
jgi:hypothetical protein